MAEQCSGVDSIEGAKAGYTNRDAWHQELHSCRHYDRHNQSPINIITSKAVYRECIQLTITSYDEPDIQTELSNNGNLVKISFLNSQLAMKDGGLINEYLADHAHFHWGSKNCVGSEHYIDSNNFPMEMHIVHYNKNYPDLGFAAMNKAGVSVFAFLFEISEDDNSALIPIDLFVDGDFLIFKTSGSERELDTSTTLALPSLSSILPANVKDFYQYSDASYSGYPYIMWTVFKDTIKISTAQIEEFRSLESSETDAKTKQPKRLGDNNRSPEEVPNLYVFRSFEVQTTKKKKTHAFAALIYQRVCWRAKE